jgi:photosystem II stability/assembly factor-like uncharacterized protein
VKILLLLILGLYSQSSFAQWQKLNSGTQEELNAIYFINKDIGYTCGRNGYVGKTTNGGSSWTDISISKAFKLHDLYFIDSLTGYVVGLNALIYKTIDGGINWTEDRPITGETEIKSVCFKDTSYGVAVGEEGKIFIYDNGQWRKQSLSNRVNLNDVEINKDGFAIIAADSGKIYSKIQSEPFFSIYSGYSSSTPFNSVQFLEDHIYLTGGWYNDSLKKFTSHFLQSTDTGNSYNALITIDLEVMHRTHFVSKEKAYYLGKSTGFYGTDNKFNNRYRLLPGTNNTLNNFYFVDENITYACGVAGTIVKTIHSPGWNTNIEEITSKSNLYPNPATSSLRLNNWKETRSISFLTLDGKLIHTIKNPTDLMDVSFLKIGTYLVRIESNSRIDMERLIKQ